MDQIAAMDPATASVLVFEADAARLAGELARDDALRGHVVAFFPHAGDYALRVAYVRDARPGAGISQLAEAPPIRLHVE